MLHESGEERAGCAHAAQCEGVASDDLADKNVTIMHRVKRFQA